MRARGVCAQGRLGHACGLAEQHAGRTHARALQSIPGAAPSPHAPNEPPPPPATHTHTATHAARLQQIAPERAADTAVGQRHYPLLPLPHFRPRARCLATACLCSRCWPCCCMELLLLLLQHQFCVDVQLSHVVHNHRNPCKGGETQAGRVSRLGRRVMSMCAGTPPPSQTYATPRLRRLTACPGCCAGCAAAAWSCLREGGGCAAESVWAGAGMRVLVVIAHVLVNTLHVRTCPQET